MKKFFLPAMLCLAVSVFANDAPKTQTGEVVEIEKYGHAVLDISIEDFEKAGFALGDTVDIVFDNGYELAGIPFFDGYYVEKGEPMLRAYPGHKNIAVCINYGKLNEIAKISEGSKATISLNLKEGALETQQVSSLKYTNKREDYSSDAVFANFRAVKMGKIGAGKLFRSASPVDNSYNRAAFANLFAEKNEIAAVLNLADTADEMSARFEAEDFASPFYKSLADVGKVVAAGMPIDYSSADFNKKLTAAIRSLSQLDAPYLVHCTEGKDRAGFTVALLAALMGAPYAKIVDDYMISFANYYNVTKKDKKKYGAIVNKNIADMLKVIADVEKPEDAKSANLAAGAQEYLLKGGMTEDEIALLKEKLR